MSDGSDDDVDDDADTDAFLQLVYAKTTCSNKSSPLVVPQVGCIDSDYSLRSNFCYIC